MDKSKVVFDDDELLLQLVVDIISIIFSGRHPGQRTTDSAAVLPVNWAVVGWAITVGLTAGQTLGGAESVEDRLEER